MSTQSRGPIVHLAFSSLYNASRLRREAESSLKAGLVSRVVAIGYQEGDSAECEEPLPGFKIVRLRRINIPLPRILKRSLQFLFWTFAAARLASREHASLVQAHSLAALPAGALARRRLKVPLIYDAHELETERTGWGALQKAIARVLEGNLIRQSDHTFVVGDMIAKWYRDKYPNRDISVLRNLPHRAHGVPFKSNYFHELLQLDHGDLVFLYLGVIDDGRGHEILVEAFQHLPTTMHLVFMGGGPAAEKIAALACATPNIHWHPPVPAAEVVSYAAGADVGISLIEDTCLSYRYCLPNKLHEYRLAGLPVIVSNLPEMARLVSSTDAGWIIEANRQSLHALIRPMTKPDIAAQRKKASRFKPLSWDDEEGHYLEVARILLKA